MASKTFPGVRSEFVLFTGYTALHLQQNPRGRQTLAVAIDDLVISFSMFKGPPTRCMGTGPSVS